MSTSHSDLAGSTSAEGDVAASAERGDGLANFDGVDESEGAPPEASMFRPGSGDASPLLAVNYLRHCSIRAWRALLNSTGL